MRSTASCKSFPPRSRAAYLSLGRWALGTLIEHGAVHECEHHGHRRDRSDPEAWNQAREAAREAPFPGTTAEQSLAALDEVAGSIGENCPDCG
jgi:hypothetical protein